MFHEIHGFYIDGVADQTATLPPDWQNRKLIIKLDSLGEKPLFLVVPGIPDLIVSKLARLEDKDRTWIAAVHQAQPLDLDLIGQLVERTAMAEEQRQRCRWFLDELGRGLDGLEQ